MKKIYMTEGELAEMKRDLAVFDNLECEKNCKCRRCKNKTQKKRCKK